MVILLFAGTCAVQFCTEAGAREELAADIREGLDRAQATGKPLGDLLQLQESIRTLIRSGSSEHEVTTRRIAHQNWCFAQLANGRTECPAYRGQTALGREGDDLSTGELPWDRVMNFSTASLMAAAMIASALVGALTGMFLLRRIDFKQIPLGLAAGLATWLGLWGITGLLTTSGPHLNPYTAAIISVGAGLSTERVFATLREVFATRLAQMAVREAGANADQESITKPVS